MIGIPCKPVIQPLFSTNSPTTLSVSNLPLYLWLNKFFPGRQFRPHLRITLDPPGLDRGGLDSLQGFLWIVHSFVRPASEFNSTGSHQVLYYFSSKEQTSFNFMATVTICNDFETQENKVLSLFLFFPHLFALKWWDQIPSSLFFECLSLNSFLLSYYGPWVPGASMRNSVHGKGHEEGGSAHTTGSSLRRTPVPEHLPP